MGESEIHARFPATRATLPRLGLCDLPTPVRRLDRLVAAAGGASKVWVKDDSRSGPLWGGNKPRKLEWLLADARARGYGTVLTFGGLGTNHGLATARYAAANGMRAALALVDQPVDDHVAAQLAAIERSASAVHRTRTNARTYLALPYLLVRHAQLRPPRPPYLLPPGGSSPLGTLGFVEAALELAAQIDRGELEAPRSILVAVGSGGTAAGLLAGLALTGVDARVDAVLVNDKLRISEASIAKLAQRALDLLAARGADLGGARADVAQLRLVRGFLGDGYGHATAEGAEATALAARTEALELEPVYTAKTFAALLHRLRGSTPPDGPVLYWHTESAVRAQP